MKNTPPPVTYPTPAVEIQELMPIQIFTIIFAAILGCMMCYSTWWIWRFYRDVRYSTESKRVWPVSHRLFDRIAPDSLPSRTNNETMVPE